jgi:hypothetical protein
MIDNENIDDAASQPFPPDDAQPDVREEIPRESLIASRDDQIPESQGDDVAEIELGEDGQGDLAPEDEIDAGLDDDGPTDLRVQDE